MSSDKSEKLTRFGVAMPMDLLSEFDQWVEDSGFANRSLALRHLVRQFIAAKKWERNDGDVCGTLTLMYDHHGNDITSELTALQHDFGGQIVCTTHVHITHESCLETLVVKGSVADLKRLEEALAALKGMQGVNVAIFALI